MRPLIRAVTAGIATAIIAVAPANAQSGAVTGSGHGKTQDEACSAAKVSARGAASVDAARTGKLAGVHVTRYEPCSCRLDRIQGSDVQTWACSVEAYYSIS